MPRAWPVQTCGHCGQQYPPEDMRPCVCIPEHRLCPACQEDMRYLLAATPLPEKRRRKETPTR